MRKYRALILAMGAAVVAVCAAVMPLGGAIPGGGGGFLGLGLRATPGPPARVPAEVAMPRPTAEEVARINKALKQFAENDTSEDRELLKKYASQLTVQVPRDNPCVRPLPSTLRVIRHGALVETAKTGDFDVMLIGDSITELLTVEADPEGNPGGKAAVAKFLEGVKIANFGVAGDTTQGVLWGLQNGEGQGHKPKAVMLLIGTNNTASALGAEIAEGIGAVVLELRKDFPDAKILLLGILPRGKDPTDTYRVKAEEANKVIARLDDQKHVFFMDIGAKFLDEKGGLKGFRSDHVHPVAEGFEIWMSAVAPTLNGWVK